MNITAKILQENNALAALSRQAGPQITEAVYSASKKSGVDFGYLMQQASVESSFDADAKAKTSSARGLYQFIDSTWLDMVKRHGAEYGIDTNQYRSKLLALRDDPDISSFMAAKFAGENKKYLEKTWGGEVGATELYLAHFMGAGGAASFLKARDKNPLQPAAGLFERAANANKSIFYDSQTRRAKTIEEVYAHFDKKFEKLDQETGDPTMTTEASKDEFFTSLRRYTNQLYPEAKGSNVISLFENIPAAPPRKWPVMSSVDFITLLKTI